MDRWKRAVVHLEGAADSTSMSARMQAMKDRSAGKITEDQYNEAVLSGSRDLRYQGTALYISKGEARYLVTARHVLHDEDRAKTDIEEELQKLQTWPDQMRPSLLENAQSRYNNTIFGIIFRVSSFDEIITHGKQAQEFLMNLGAGSTDTHPYTFSTPELDVAIISLSSKHTLCDMFRRELDERGYIPVPYDDIADGPTAEGEDIFTVGYPGSTSVLGSIDDDVANSHWSSNAVSLPVFSFGKVAMLHDNLSFFWGDISIYPGNSGGPIVQNDKLVGIVSANATITIEGASNRMRIPFAKLIKSGNIRHLIDQQEKKDSFWHRLSGKIADIPATQA